MSITLTKEKRFVVLISITDLDGSATKEQVLDNIQSRNYLSFSRNDLEIKSNRPELYWRNDLAYVRRNLVDAGCIDDSVYGVWTITDQGVDHLSSLCQDVISSQLTGFQKLTPFAVQRAIEISSGSGREIKVFQNELIEDKMTPPNETQEALIIRIKRYKKIVDEVKQKYDGRCQIENCGFTFLKSNGENYAEGHHLVPLSQGGQQTVENVVILCANHHRMFHYADVEIGEITSKKRRPVFVNGEELAIIYTG